MEVKESLAVDPMLREDGPSVAWFCVRSQMRHEQIAARHLRQIEGVDVFNPRIRFSRPDRRGPTLVTESLFPNYLFVRFDWRILLPRIHYAPGVAGIVHFGPRWPQVPEAAIGELRANLGADDLHIIPTDFEPGQRVQIAGGVLHGLTAVISRVMGGTERVMILMDFLGRQTMVEIAANSIVPHIVR